MLSGKEAIAAERLIRAGQFSDPSALPLVAPPAFPAVRYAERQGGWARSTQINRAEPAGA
ncbi:MAG TPA: hypothetical protein VND19_06105 [Acetobacteraceae bacterium]|nr:hypothetical protein [Acetobacteraceae bacterium]